MPMYSYKCNKCSKESEHFHRIVESLAGKPCDAPECAGVLDRQIAGNTTFWLAGTGWARDGYQKR